jgi:hypothetical protein
LSRITKWNIKGTYDDQGGNSLVQATPAITLHFSIEITFGADRLRAQRRLLVGMRQHAGTSIGPAQFGAGRNLLEIWFGLYEHLVRKS